MEFRSTILDYAARFETHLGEKYGAVGRGLHEKVTSVENQLPSWLVGQLRFIATIRNKAVHEAGFQPDDPEGTLKTCKKIEIDFGIEPLALSSAPRAAFETLSAGVLPPVGDVPFEVYHGVKVSEGQIHSPAGAFRLSDTQSVRIQRNSLARYQWFCLIGCVVYAAIFHGLAIPVLLIGFWGFFFVREYAVQITTSSGLHTLAKFSTFNALSEQNMNRITKQSHAVLTLISNALGTTTGGVPAGPTTRTGR